MSCPLIFNPSKVTHAVVSVVAVDDGEALGYGAVVSYTPESDVLDGTSRCSTVLLVVGDLDLSDGSVLDVLYSNVVEDDVAHEVVVAAVDGEASLVIDLGFGLSEDVDVLVSEVLDGVAAFGVAVDTDEDGVCEVGPEGAVAHGDIACGAAESLACGVGCSAVVGVAAEYAVEEDIG